MQATVEPAWIEAVEQRTDLPTKQLPIKWVIVVDRDLRPGLLANAAACLAAAVGKAAPALVGSAGADASGGSHSGLPWTGCMILAATAPIVRVLRAEARAEPDLLVADMTTIAQRVRVYDDYLSELARTEDEDLTYFAVSIAGPRACVDRLTGRFPLLR
jgi:hypothetical protein